MKPSIFFFGNCHAGVSRNAIGRLGSVTDNFDLFFVRYEFDMSTWHPEIVDALSRCALFFEQIHSDGKASREAVHQRLPKDCRIVRFAPAFLNSLWPFVVEDPRNKRYDVLPEGTYPRFLCNRFVLENMQNGDLPEDAAKRFLETDITGLMDLDRLHQIAIAQLKGLERGLDITMAQFIADNMATRRLFLMPLHPAGETFAELVRQMIEIIGVPSGDAVTRLIGDLRKMHGVGAYDAPLHPQVVAHFGLTWAEGLLYRHFDEGDFTHDECVLRHARFDFGMPYYAGVRALGMGDPHAAYPMLLQAIIGNLKSQYYQRRFGRLAIQLGKYDDAIKALSHGLNHHPQNATLWLELARAAYEIQKPEFANLADRASQQAVLTAPESADAWRIRSWMLGRAGRIPEADFASKRHHWLRAQPALRPFTEEGGAEYGRHWLGYVGNGF